ncbi:hypothetical protein HELRODRAFT_193114 [Helobdella robusta]|uniref:Uncharacterized protein n=1 Tax=Helobdella robusta TaxID=6412 RepID=T1FUM8_HELRO|nr:hypothetical protein HELRODRAFT_193114 [Helobdella robusta]ESN98166.1 hypothetical protein HELRODRAFT_193114 [Helobdella robusta]
MSNDKDHDRDCRLRNNDVDVDDDYDDDKVQAMTDGYSLSSIKYLIELTSAHMSELLRVICLHCLIETNEFNHQTEFGFDEISSIVKQLLMETNRQTKPLENCLTLFQTVQNKMADETGSSDHVSRVGSDWPLGARGNALRSMQVVVHSLKLHLQSALMRTHKTEDANKKSQDNIDNEDYENGTDGNSEVEMRAFELIAAEAKQIGQELKASKDCLEELESLVAKLTRAKDLEGSSKQASSVREQAVVSDSNDVGSAKEPVLVTSDDVPKTEDEVFEALSMPRKNGTATEEDDDLEHNVKVSSVMQYFGNMIGDSDSDDADADGGAGVDGAGSCGGGGSFFSAAGDDDDDDDEAHHNDNDDDVSESQSSDVDSDDIYHVTDDDEGFDGVNVGYDDDDDEDDDDINDNNINNNN